MATTSGGFAGMQTGSVMRPGPTGAHGSARVHRICTNPAGRVVIPSRRACLDNVVSTPRTGGNPMRRRMIGLAALLCLTGGSGCFGKAMHGDGGGGGTGDDGGTMNGKM